MPSKRDGPILTSTFKGTLDAVPLEFRAGLTITQTTQAVTLDDTISAPSGVNVGSTLEHERTNERDKTTWVISGLPVAQTGKRYTDEYGGGTTTVTRTYGDNSTVTPVAGLQLVEWAVAPAINGLSVQEKEELNDSSWPVLHGQELDRRTGSITPFTRQTIAENASLGTALSSINPIDRSKATIETYSAPSQAQIEAVPAKVSPGYVDIRLPDVLESVEVVYNVSAGNGSHTENGNGFSGGTSASLSLSLNGSGQGSCSIQPDLLVTRRLGNRGVRECRYVSLDIPTGQNLSYVLTRLTTILGATVNAWPKFTPRTYTLSVHGESVSLAVDAAVQQTVSGSDTTYSHVWSEGNGFRQERSVATRNYDIPPVIHQDLNFTNSAKKQQTVTAQCGVGWPAATNWPARSAGNAIPFTIEGEVFPKSLDATPGVAVIPSTGLYLESIRTEESGIGVLRALCCVFDFANL